MSVWPNTISPAASLIGSEGALVSVSIHIAPRLLESLLEALVEVDFPVNPQIYHDGAMVYFYDDGRQRTDPATLVEFPAYATKLDSLRNILESHGFDPGSIAVYDMLDQLRSEGPIEPAPDGAEYRSRRRLKVAGLARTATLQ